MWDTLLGMMEENSCKYAYLGRLEGDRCELPWCTFARCGNSSERVMVTRLDEL